MANSMLSLIFPIRNIVSKKNSEGGDISHSHHTATESINLAAMHKRLFVDTDKTSLQRTKQCSLNTFPCVIPQPPYEIDAGTFCLLVSGQTNIEPFHQTNLLFQSALTIALNKTTGGRMSSTVHADRKSVV